MRNEKSDPRGRITNCAPPTPEDVEDRARELSLIGGHQPNAPTSSEVEQARRELLGDDAGDAPVDEPGIQAKRLDKRPFSTGKRTEPQLPRDDETLERTVQEGIDEAGHSEMIEAAKSKTRSEG
jgi:hypothetical protein